MARPIKYGDVIALEYQGDSPGAWLTGYAGYSANAKLSRGPGDWTPSPDWSDYKPDQWTMSGNGKKVGDTVKFGDVVAIQYQGDTPGAWLTGYAGYAAAALLSRGPGDWSSGWSGNKSEQWKVAGNGKTAGMAVTDRDVIAFEYQGDSPGAWLTGYNGYAAAQILSRGPGDWSAGWSRQMDCQWKVWSAKYSVADWCMAGTAGRTGVCHDQVAASCGDNMTSACLSYVQTHPGEFDQMAGGWCATHLDDPFCSCYTPMPADAPAELRAISTKPQCWSAGCQLHGYKNTNLKNDISPCSNIVICTQNINEMNNQSKYNMNNVVKQECPVSSPLPVAAVKYVRPASSASPPASPPDSPPDSPDKPTDPTPYMILLMIVIVVAILIRSRSQPAPPQQYPQQMYPQMAPQQYPQQYR